MNERTERSEGHEGMSKVSTAMSEPTERTEGHEGMSKVSTAMSERTVGEKQRPDRFWSVIDIPKTLAGALAAVCAAVVGSYLGVAGTLVGAAVASVVGTVGTELYGRSFQRGAKRLQTLAPTFVRAPAAIGTPPVAAATAADSPSHTVPAGDSPTRSVGDSPTRSVPVDDVSGYTDGTSDKSEQSGAAEATPGTIYSSGAENSLWRRIRWSRVAIVAGAVFVLAMGALTVTELITGKSVASSVGNGTKARTTFGGLVDPGGPASPSTSTSPTPSATSTAVPSTATSTVPSTAPSESARSRSTAPTTAPPTLTTEAPAPTPTVGLGQTSPGRSPTGQTQGTTAP